MASSLESLIGRMARPSGLPRLSADSEGIQQPAQSPDGFVPPELVPRSNAGRNAAIVLVAAPAAVGKSWLSRHISAESGNPYWDLSEFRVGSNFFSGTIAKAYGGHGFAELVAALANGGVTLVIDAADEALVRAGASNFEAALTDLSSLVGDAPKAHPSAVIFGRPETIEMAAVVLEETSIPWEVVDVEYFPERAARAFVHAKARSGEGKVSRADVDAFLTTFFENALSALDNPSWEANREFLGYSPVLDALAEYATSPDNPHSELTSLLDGQGDIEFWRLIGQIVEGICERETRRFARTFGAGHAVRGDAARASYTVEEQFRLLLEPSLDSAVLRVPKSVPDELRDALVEAAQSQLSEHPFVRRAGSRGPNALLRFSSPVFRDFVLAWALLNADERTVGRVEGWAGEPAFNPTPMVFRFASVGVGHQNQDLSLAALPVLTQAAASDPGRRLGVQVTFDPESGSQLEGQLVLASGVNDLAVFRLRADEGRAIRLYRSLVRFDLEAPELVVELGGQLRDLSIGPDVFVRAGALRVVSEDVRVVGGEVDSTIYLEAADFTALQTRLRVFSDARFRVNAPDLYFPWQRYAGESLESESGGSLVSAGIDLRQILRRFNRSSMAGRLTYPREAMDTVLRKGRVPRELFDYCVDRGVIEARGDMYAFVEPPPAVAIANVNVEDPQLREFLQGYIARG